MHSASIGKIVNNCKLYMYKHTFNCINQSMWWAFSSQKSRWALPDKPW